ncbi:MAG: hypothetical protein ACR2HN_10455 [Tepidiformaceae bacterium]
MFSIIGLKVEGVGLVSFTTGEFDGQRGFLLSWVMDTRTGEAWPLTAGAQPILLH